MFKPFQQSRSVVTYFEKNKIDPYGTSITTDNTHDALLSIFTDSSEICDFYQSNYLLRSKT